jgi:membrane fusion protein (multidrug efflux system)
MELRKLFRRDLFGYVFLLSLAIYQAACTPAPSTNEQPSVPTAALPVVRIGMDSVSTYRDYTAALEGRTNVDIRAQVDGYLKEILVDEGAFVQTGQPLFKIDDKVYREQLNTAIADLHLAEARMNSAQIEIDKLTPLVKNNVISPIQLQSATASFHAASASVEQARAAVTSARINLDFTLVRAPVNGFIGRIPKRIGGLVSRADMQALTTLSDIQEIRAYFNLSESGFLSLNRQAQGQPMQEMIRHLRPVTLVLANGEPYPYPGKIDLVNGQFDRTTGSISVRATFPNPGKLLRSGITGMVRMEEHLDSAVLVPISATLDQQDKTFVYLVGDSDIVKRQAITVSGKSGTNYIIREGIRAGDRIVTAGIENLAEGTRITAPGTK